MRQLVSLVSLLVMLGAAWVPAQAQLMAESLNPKLVTVNGEPIFAADVSIVLQNMVAQMQQQGQQQADPEKMVPAALKRVVENKLLAQEATRRGLQVSPERVDKVMKSIEASRGGRDKLEAALRQGGTDYERFRKSVMEMELIREMVVRDIRSEVSASEAEIKEFYDSNPQLFSHPELVRARHILFETAEDAGGEELEAALVKAEAARERALAGEDFAELARELSEGPSAADGGNLGPPFPAEQMMPPFARALADLEPGEVSAPVRTNFGYHVIKLEERIAAVDKQPLEDVRSSITEAVQQHKITEAIAELLKSLMDKAKVEPAEGHDLPPDLFDVPAAPM